MFNRKTNLKKKKIKESKRLFYHRSLKHSKGIYALSPHPYLIRALKKKKVNIKKRFTEFDILMNEYS